MVTKNETEPLFLEGWFLVVAKLPSYTGGSIYIFTPFGSGVFENAKLYVLSPLRQ